MTPTPIDVTRSSKVIWLDLFDDTQMAIERDEAMRLDRRGFAKLYRCHVPSAGRREARAWADRQIALRDRVVAAQAELAAR